MLNLVKHNSMTEEKFTVLGSLLEGLETQGVAINYITKLFDALTHENCFYGYVSEEAVFIGNMEYCARIEKENVIDVVYNKFGDNVSVDIALCDGSLIKVWN